MLKDFGGTIVRYLEDALLPRVIDGTVARRYARKAVRTGVWRHLSAESRALLRALSAWRGVVRSPVLRAAVGGILLRVELATLRGRALLFGLAVTARSGLRGALRSAETLLCLGISYLSNPPAFRLLG